LENVIFRLYEPLDAWFIRTWQMLVLFKIRKPSATPPRAFLFCNVTLIEPMPSEFRMLRTATKSE